MIILYEQDKEGEEWYRSFDHSFRMEREYGQSPDGNPLKGSWVLRSDGTYMDHDQYRYDLAARHDMQLIYPRGK